MSSNLPLIVQTRWTQTTGTGTRQITTTRVHSFVRPLPPAKRARTPRSNRPSVRPAHERPEAPNRRRESSSPDLAAQLHIAHGRFNLLASSTPSTARALRLRRPLQDPLLRSIRRCTWTPVLQQLQRGGRKRGRRRGCRKGRTFRRSIMLISTSAGKGIISP